MIKFEIDLDVTFKNTSPDALDMYSSQERLFEKIVECLKKNGINTGYSLGRLGGSEGYSLFKYLEYWLLVYSERANNELIGIFVDFHDATDFFLCKMLDTNDNFFDWKEVFD